MMAGTQVILEDVKKTLVVGLQRSGVGAANLLAGMGNEVTVTDMKTEAELKEYVKQLAPSVRVSLGEHPQEIFDKADLIVVSPGVPLDIEPLKLAKERGIKVIGELELAYIMLRDVPFYAVTGTNGKSTTATLLDLMMKKAGRRCLFGGNIGNALTAGVADPGARPPTRGVADPLAGVADPCVVAEVSSFQLESIVEFRPKGAAILNITADHLDRHHSMEEYGKAKERIFLNQKEGDFLLLNADDPACMEISERMEISPSSGPEVFYFTRRVYDPSRKDKIRGVYLKGDAVHWNGTSLFKTSDVRIKGVHNLENAMAASAMALLAGCQLQAVVESLREFPGLPHRLEFVREINGVRFINDSKGTNAGAVIRSIESFSGPVILIAGGRDKGVIDPLAGVTEGARSPTAGVADPFSALARAVRGKVKAAVLIGEARQKLKDSLGGVTMCDFAQDLEEAVKKAAELASSGDVVLLSPACASFDMFRDFEDRGEQFKALVMGL